MHATPLHSSFRSSSICSSNFRSSNIRSSFRSSPTKLIPTRANRANRANPSSRVQMLACHFLQTGRSLAMAFHQLALSKVSLQCILDRSPANPVLTMDLRRGKQASPILGVSRNQHVGQPVLRLTNFSRDVKRKKRDSNMTRQFLLMRHAKSDWKDSRLGDKERPLNSRGRSTAPIMAQWIVEHDLMPNSVLCSSAIRTQQTLDLMLQQWTAMQVINPTLVLPQVCIEDRLYLASDSLILSVAQESATVCTSGSSILVLGHNPGMEILASNLGGCGVTMPTGAIAILNPVSPDGEWPDDWENVKSWKWGGLVKPRELGTETI